MTGAVSVAKKLYPVAKVLYKNRKTEMALILAAGSIVRQIAQALGH